MQSGITLKWNCVLLCIFILLSPFVYSKTFQTIADGNWSDSSVWFDNEIPPYFPSDSILIKDSIRFDQDISLSGNSLLLVDRGGGLCGHRTIWVNTGTSLCNAGILEVDSLIIAGGYYLNFGTGELLFRDIMIVTGGWGGGSGSAYFTDSSHGCGCYWEECFTAAVHQYDPPPDSVIVRHDCMAKMFPSTGDGNLKLEYNIYTAAWFTMYNMAGQLMHKEELNQYSGTETVHAETFSNGLYLWEVSVGDHFCGRGKIIITH